MRGRFNRKDTYWEADVGQPTAVEGISPGELSPLAGDSTSSEGPEGPASPTLTLTLSGSADMGLDDRLHKTPSCPEYGLEKRYLGVRVKMPVKDMLRNIRLAQGCDPQELQEKSLKRSKGEKKRVNTCKERRSSKRKRPNKSLEELAIIVEVLEEDLKLGNTYSSLRPAANSNPSSAFLLSLRSTEPSDHTWTPTPPPCGSPGLGPLSICSGAPDLCSPSNDSMSDSGSSDCLSQHLPSSQQCMAGYHSAGYHSTGYHSADDSDDMIPSPEYVAARSSPGSAEFWPAAPPPSPRPARPRYDPYGDQSERPARPRYDPYGDQSERPARPRYDPYGNQSERPARPRYDPYGDQSERPARPRYDPYGDQSAGSHGDDGGGLKAEGLGSGNRVGQSSGAYFLSQLQREESELKDTSDDVLLASDGQGRVALHRVACLGKRAQGYAIAKRMATIHCLDLKDSEGMTALHLAARHNQHLMVADLIVLGANPNEKEASGKSCLHICAERGYIRVLEVVKDMMSDGVFVDMDATDNHGLSVLQCAALGLSSTVRELEGRASPGQARLHTLRKEQMMETLECLLQMDSHPPGSAFRDKAFDVRPETEPHQFMQGPKSYMKKGNPATKTWSIL